MRESFDNFTLNQKIDRGLLSLFPEWATQAQADSRHEPEPDLGHYFGG
jgi:hypothetical protein